MKLLAKFKNILYMVFTATLNFRKFKVALNLINRIFLNFARSCVLSFLSNVNFTITAEIHARSLAKFYGQNADRHINLKIVRASANESGKFDNLLS